MVTLNDPVDLRFGIPAVPLKPLNQPPQDYIALFPGLRDLVQRLTVQIRPQDLALPRLRTRPGRDLGNLLRGEQLPADSLERVCFQRRRGEGAGAYWAASALCHAS